MKQKFTSEKNKYLVNKNENETMFNFKISCLMKKQLINLMMTLAIVFGLSVSAMAQGLQVDSPYEIAIGATANFEVGANANSSFEWDVFELADDHTEGAADPGTTVDGDGSGANDKVTISSPTSNSTDIRFYEMQSDNTLFVVQCTETGASAQGSCTTIRRFYAAVFDFDIDVVALAANVSTLPVGGEATPAAPTDWSVDYPTLSECNSWSGDVVQNWLDSTWIRSMHVNSDSLNNATDTEPKYTDSYFAVRLTVDGANFQNYKARFQWSMDSTADASIYEMRVVSGSALFSGQSGDAFWTAGGLDQAITVPGSYIDDTYTTDQTMYVPHAATSATETVHIIRVRTHNLAGESAMKFNMKIDRLQLEKDAAEATTDYNNGEKYNAETSAGTDGLARLDGTKDISHSITISQSPATAIIGIDD
jgi:hypothetical protein